MDKKNVTFRVALCLDIVMMISRDNTYQHVALTFV